MDREEILRKYKAEGEDEGKEYNNQKGDDASQYGLALLALILVAYKALKGLPCGDILALLFCYCSIGGFSRYKADKDRDKFHLIMGLSMGVVCLACLGWYLWETLM